MRRRDVLAVFLFWLTAVSGLAWAQAAPPDARRTLGAPRGRPLSGAVLEQETKRVTALLRCPVCQGLSVADSPTSIAAKMKDQARELLAAGYDEEQILGYFEGSYGEFVRLDPPRRGVNWLVWLAPVLGLVAGAAVVVHSLRRLRAVPSTPRDAEPAPKPASEPDPLPEDPRLAEYVLRVRALAYGWQGGVRPREPSREPAGDP